MSVRSLRGLALGSLAVCFGFLLGHLSSALLLSRSVPPGEQERAGLVAYRLTSPFLESVGSRDADPSLAGARARVEEYIRRRTAQDPTLRVGVYARDLISGAWIGVNEEEAFQPASLMKVSVLIYTLHRISLDTSLRLRTAVYPGPEAMPSPDNMGQAPVEHRMVPGEGYTTLDLLWRMIGYSDNHAKDLLLSDVPPGAVDRFLAAHGVPVLVQDGETVMTPQAYAVLFRLLFNSSVLGREDSEYALDLLTRATFSEGFRAVVPAEVPVASKFGSFFSREAVDQGVQLHECGIVYVPNRPLAICVMTSSILRGDTLPGIIRDVAAEVLRLET